MEKEEITCTCTYCEKKLKGDDKVYFLETDMVSPYCSLNCMVNDLNYQIISARDW